MKRRRKKLQPLNQRLPICPLGNAVEMRKLAGERDKRRAEESESSGVIVYQRV